MKRSLMSLAVVIAALMTVTVVWARGGGMGAGMMGRDGHMMESSGRQPMFPGQGRGEMDNSEMRRQEQRRAQEVYDRDMRELNREIGDLERSLNREIQKERPDKTRIEKLRRNLADLKKRSKARRLEFERKWQQ